LKPLDLTQAASGKNIFNQKCLTCHNLDTKKLGPPLRNVVKDRSPEFIMNLLLNTDEMQKKNETIKKLIKQYNNLLMINYKLTKKDATDLLEYLRAAAEKKM
jgi:mono/diheme cytochrome c family protein